MRKPLALALIFVLLLFLILAIPVLFSLISKPRSGYQNPDVQVPAPPKSPSLIPEIPLPLYSKPSPSELAPPPSYNLTAMELGIHELVNKERARYGLGALEYNPDLANVARDHSIELARENAPLTDPGIYCHKIFIHHEGFDFGLYETDRLLNRSIYYFELVGENIFMTSAWKYLEADASYPPCAGGLEIVEEYDSPEAVLKDYQDHLDYASKAPRVNWTEADWLSQDGLEEVVVDGWMQSPGHRANLLEPAFGEEGIGVAKVNDFIIVTELLIDRAECGYPGAVCCEDEEGEYCFDPWECKGKECRWAS